MDKGWAGDGGDGESRRARRHPTILVLTFHTHKMMRSACQPGCCPLSQLRWYPRGSEPLAFGHYDRRDALVRGEPGHTEGRGGQVQRGNTTAGGRLTQIPGERGIQWLRWATFEIPSNSLHSPLLTHNSDSQPHNALSEPVPYQRVQRAEQRPLSLPSARARRLARGWQGGGVRELGPQHECDGTMVQMFAQALVGH